MLSTKVINLRKEVDQQRHGLRVLQEDIAENNKKRLGLEQELRTIEGAERRRNEVALETEKSLTEVKYEA